MGDDLVTVNGFYDNGFWGTIFNPINAQMGKVRPVSTLLLYICFRLGKLDYSVYVTINRIILGIVCYFIYVLLCKIKLDKISSYFVALLIISTPFSTYGVWQMIGICEITSLCCSMLCFYCVWQMIWSDESKQISKYVLICTLVFSVMIFNAERFMYFVAIFCFVVFFLKIPNWKEKVSYSVLFFFPIIVRYLVIKLAGGNSLNTGRGDTVNLFNTIVQYAIKGVVNLFGFSIGQQWHGGFDYYALPVFILIIGSIFFFIGIGVFFVSLSETIKTKNKSTYELLIMFLFSFSSLFSYALVGMTHGEDRFLWISYLFLIMGIAKYFYNNCKKQIFIVFSFCLLFMNWYYVDNKQQVNFRYSQEMAQTCYDNITVLLEEKSDVDYFVCVKPGDYNWVFDNEVFFRYYFKDNVEVFYYDSFEQIDYSIIDENTIVVYPDENFEVPYAVTACWIDDLNVK